MFSRCRFFAREGIGLARARDRPRGRSRARAPARARETVNALEVSDEVFARARASSANDDVVASAAHVERVIAREDVGKTTRTLKTRSGEESGSANARANGSASVARANRRRTTAKEDGNIDEANARATKATVEDADGRRKQKFERWARAKKAARGTSGDTSTKIESDEEADLCKAIQELTRIERLEELMRDEEEKLRLEEIAERGVVEALAARERAAKDLKRAFEPALAARAGYDSISKLRGAIRAGKMARKKLVQRNIGLAARVGIQLYNYVHPQDKGSLSQQDFVHEGVTGLIRASEKFDPSKGYKFSTYANAWITQTAMRGMYANGRLIRLPEHVHYEKQRAMKQRKKVDGLAQDYVQASGPSESEFSAERLEEFAQISLTPLSLDMAGSEEDLEMDDMDVAMYEEGQGGVQVMTYEVERELLRDALVAAFNTLPPRESYVLKHRFGLVGERQSYVQIGKAIDLTGETVRTIEKNALMKLRVKEGPTADLIAHLDRTHDRPEEEGAVPLPIWTAGTQPSKRGRKAGGANKPKTQKIETPSLDLVRSVL